MYITNTTFTVEPHAHAMWLDIMKNKFVPMLAENGYEVTEFCRVLSAGPEAHFTYSIQVGIRDMENYCRFTEDMLGEWNNIAGPIFGSSVLWFNSLMKKVKI